MNQVIAFDLSLSLIRSSLAVSPARSLLAESLSPLCHCSRHSSSAAILLRRSPRLRASWPRFHVFWAFGSLFSQPADVILHSFPSSPCVVEVLRRSLLSLHRCSFCPFRSGQVEVVVARWGTDELQPSSMTAAEPFVASSTGLPASCDSSRTLLPLVCLSVCCLF